MTCCHHAKQEHPPACHINLATLASRQASKADQLAVTIDAFQKGSVMLSCHLAHSSDIEFFIKQCKVDLQMT